MAIEEKALRMPKQIKPGDTLGVVAPSMPVKPEEKEKLTAYLQDAGSVSYTHLTLPTILRV